MILAVDIVVMSLLLGDGSSLLFTYFLKLFIAVGLWLDPQCALAYYFSTICYFDFGYLLYVAYPPFS